MSVLTPQETPDIFPPPEHILSSALAQLRLKLLDLTGRNRLINFKHTVGKSLQFVEGQPADIYQKLVEANNKSTINILGLPEPSRHDWVERNGRLQKPEPREWAKAQGVHVSFDIPNIVGSDGNSNVRALMYLDDLAKHCRKIEREAILAIEETGANMLFLVLGFLEFPDQKDSDRTFAAPLISIPVTLLKKEVIGIQTFSLQFTEDDISENLSLKEKLRNDFGLILPELDEDQINVTGYFDAVNQTIKHQPGFALKHKVSLCLLSFTNMLLVRDLDPTKWPQDGGKNGLIDHPIVREVFEGSSDDSGTGLSIAGEHPIEDGPGAIIPLVYDADSSQHSALVDALILKKNLVIEGPPGTGKSQTITNLIAACLAEGKKVLFVAEKLAALEVVKNRLSMAGLDPFVLELHSNKTNKKRVLEELGKRIAYKSSPLNDLPRLQQQLESYRIDLKAYSDVINSITHNTLGLTLHQVMWRAEKHRSALIEEQALLSQMTVADATQISEFELSRRMDCLAHLSSQYKVIGGFDNDSTFWGFFPHRMIPGDEVNIANTFRSSIQWAKKLCEDSDSLAGILGGNINGLTVEFGRAQVEILIQLLAGANRELPLHLIPGFFERDKTGEKTGHVLTSFAKHLLRYREALSAEQRYLKLEAPLTKGGLEGFKALLRIAEGMGVKLGSLEELRSLYQQLSEIVAKLKLATAAIAAFAHGKEIPFDQSRQKLEQLLGFTNLIIDVPEADLYLQTLGLTRDGAIRAIESLMILQEEWTKLKRELDEQLYVDAPPLEGNVIQAILTFREGDAWYRIFQGRWRSAIALHKSIQRNKRKMSGRERLIQLERLVTFMGLKEKWRMDPAWTQFLGLTAPAEPLAIENYLTLAKWNRAIKLASEDIGTTFIDPMGLTSEQARVLRREFSAIKMQQTIAIVALEAIDTKLERLHELADMGFIEKIVSRMEAFLYELEEQLKWIEPKALGKASCQEVTVACEAALERTEIKLLIDDNDEAKWLLGEHYASVDTDMTSVMEVFTFGQYIDGLHLSGQIKNKLRSNHPLETCDKIKNILGQVSEGLASVINLTNEMQRFGKYDPLMWIGGAPDEDLQEFVKALVGTLDAAIADADRLIPWSSYIARRNEACELGLIDFVALLENKGLSPDELANAYAYCSYATITREAFRHIPQLGRFTGLKHNEIRKNFQSLDKEIISIRGRAIGHECARKAAPPYGRNGIRVDDKSEMVLLNHLVPQQRPRMPVRKMLLRAGGSIQALKPCFMMGPQAVAQYLTPGVIKFDLVIMDEASQLKPEEAIGAIARGGQLVVVGDSKQLPPTSFFSRMSQTGDDDDQFTTTDAESILDVCSSHFQPMRSLRWHYRSQHHSLIAFSNHHFYRGNLIIFPSPYGQGGSLGIRAVYLADAIYENQSNLREARRVVDAVVEHIAHRSNESLGVVTLNIKQRDLIAELLEDRLKLIKGADSYREHWISEGQPLFIKNLENVQGDERDAIIISTTFGKPVGSNAVRQNFGPISRQGGWRRLNVLFTRAKKSVAIYTSLRPEDIVLDRATPEGTKALRHYLEYARTGSLTIAEETGREPDSDFEISVMNMLCLRGYEVTPQLGVAGYRLDIAVKHPDASGSYLAAIECDGASYHSALSVRDRDRIRQEILEALGWRGRIWRIWSTDWFRTPRQEANKLIGFLEDLRKSWTPEHTPGMAWIEEGQNNTNVGNAGIKNKKTESRQIPLDMLIEEEREAVNTALINTADDLEVEVGDVVRYVRIDMPEDMMTVQITAGKDDFANGVVNKSRPLAQILLGAVTDDEVTLHLPGSAPKIFKILEIKKAKK